MNKFIALLFTLVVATFVSVPHANADNLFDGIPTYEIGDVVPVRLVCLDEDSILTLARSTETLEEFRQQGQELITAEKCIFLPSGANVEIDRYVTSFNGYLGNGEVWTLKSDNEKKVFVMLIAVGAKPNTGV